MKMLLLSWREKLVDLGRSAAPGFRDRFPFAHSLFMKIAEPRVLRVLQFGVYICLIVAGGGVLANPPTSFENVIGLSLVYVFGGFLIIGAMLGAFAVLPGIWWLERVGILVIVTGLLMYIVMVVSLQSSSVGIGVSIAFILNFMQRWSEIKGAQLAPKEG